MVNLEVHSAKVKLRDKWEDITLKEAIELYKLARKLPDYVISLFEEKLKEDPDEKRIAELSSKITAEDQFKVLPSIYGEMLQLLSNISEETLKKTTPVERKVLFDNFFAHLVLGLLFWPAYESQGINSFTHEGVEYFLPNSTKLFGYEKPGVDLTALEFTEMADLQIAAAHLEEGKFGNASKIIAILCRPEGESYDEVKSGNRAESFMSLTMDKVWEVFFSLVESTTILQQHSLLSTLRVEVGRLSVLKSKLMGGMPASWKLRKRGHLGISKKLKKRTRTTS